MRDAVASGAIAVFTLTFIAAAVAFVLSFRLPDERLGDEIEARRQRRSRQGSQRAGLQLTPASALRYTPDDVAANSVSVVSPAMP